MLLSSALLILWTIIGVLMLLFGSNFDHIITEKQLRTRNGVEGKSWRQRRRSAFKLKSPAITPSCTPNNSGSNYYSLHYTNELKCINTFSWFPLTRGTWSLDPCNARENLKHLSRFHNNVTLTIQKVIWDCLKSSCYRTLIEIVCY